LQVLTMEPEHRLTLKSWFNPTSEELAANRRILFSLRGRVGRLIYWQFAVAAAIVFGVLAVLFDLHLRMGPMGFPAVIMILCWLTFAVGVKRCHDRGRSGWFLLVNLIPVVGAPWVLVEPGFLPAIESGARQVAA
jgi:uncharacterized membrane protein YhaH (DUF805 family)